LKALDSPLNYMARRHPKLTIGYRLANHASAFRRSKFSRDKVCNRWPILPASPRRFSSGSYVRSDIPIQTSSIIPKKRSFRRFEYQKRTKSHENRHFLAEYGGGGRNGGQTSAGNPRAAHCTGGAAGVRALPAVGCRLGHSTLRAPYTSEAVDVSSSPSRLNAVGGGTPTLPEKQETT
jgi:hypothetical protein